MEFDAKIFKDRKGKAQSNNFDRFSDFSLYYCLGGSTSFSTPTFQGVSAVLVIIEPGNSSNLFSSNTHDLASPKNQTEKSRFRA